MPYLALIAATAVGATGGLFIKSSPFTSLALGGFRTLVPLILLLPIMIRRKGLTGPAGSRRVLWGASVINAGRLLLYILAFKLSSMGNAVVIFYTWPVFTMIIHAALLRRPPGFREIAVILTAFAGAVIMNIHRDFGAGSMDIIGSLSMIGASLLYAAHNILMKKGLDFIDEIGGMLVLSDLIQLTDGTRHQYRKLSASLPFSPNSSHVA
jgi:drug/metabolite transporter (DMT)-like permease